MESGRSWATGTLVDVAHAGPRRRLCGVAVAAVIAASAAASAGVWALAADTDGIDGMEDNAGAVVAPETLSRALALGMKIDDFLGRNDAYGYFRQLDDLVISGPTHTNVNDFRAILVL